MLQIPVPILALAGSLSVTIASPQSTVLVGEPVKLFVSWRAAESLSVYADDDDYNLQFLRVVVDNGAGARVYFERREGAPDDTVKLASSLGGGEVRLTSLELYQGIQIRGAEVDPALLFPVPGRYSLTLIYDDDVTQAQSNTVSFTVLEPRDCDAVLLGRLQQDPSLLTPGNRDLHELLRQCPASPYLRLSQIRALSEKSLRILNGLDPDTGEPMGLHGEELAAFQASRCAELLSAVETANWGAFEEDALTAGAAFAGCAANSAAAERLRGELSDLRSQFGDTTPPTIRVSASPAILWPPDHQLAATRVAVEVMDDRDPNPAVKLVSITCDDACKPAVDVVGADVGTDDREISLRAERKGGGSGRTYTITYSATDASGNSTLAAATVVVPHDQGER